jgi:poly(A) polymerase
MTSPASRRVLAALGGAARFVGGCVRDALLGLTPTDIDIATPLPPETVMRQLRAARIRVVPTGLDHGTVTALVGGSSFEITTLRRDVACDGRHAEVAFTDDWLADAARRDFTFNALSCTADGVLYDPFDGVGDLAAGRVRFIGSAEARIREDVLRLLRFFRFYARFGRPPPDAEALAACRLLAPLLPGLSGERVRAELFRILDHPRCAEIWALMIDHAILSPLLPEATRVGRLAGLVRLGGDQTPVLRLAAVLETDRGGAQGVAARLRLSRAERERLEALVVEAARGDFDPGRPPQAVRRALVRLGDAALAREAILVAAAGSAAPPADLAAALAAALAIADHWATTRFPLTGQDVLALGLPPGPAVGRLLEGVRLWWAEQAFAPDRAGCLGELARQAAIWHSR